MDLYLLRCFWKSRRLLHVMLVCTLAVRANCRSCSSCAGGPRNVLTALRVAAGVPTTP